jgi:hypothetical protein
MGSGLRPGHATTLRVVGTPLRPAPERPNRVFQQPARIIGLLVLFRFRSSYPGTVVSDNYPPTPEDRLWQIERLKAVVAELDGAATHALDAPRSERQPPYHKGEASEKCRPLGIQEKGSAGNLRPSDSSETLQRGHGLNVARGLGC